MGKSIDLVTGVLGPPEFVSALGSFQFVQYKSTDCLSQPNCFVTLPCELKLTVRTASSVIETAKIDGTVFGSPDARAVFLPYVARLCNASFSKRLAPLSGSSAP